VSLLVRRMRFEPGVALTMLLLIGGTSFLFAALPRLFNSFADDGLRYTIEHASPLARNVRALERARIPARDADALASVERRAASSQAALPASVRELIDSRTFVARSPRYIFSSDRRPVGGFARGLFRYLTLRAERDVRSHLGLVAGRWPSGSGRRVAAPVARPVNLDRPAGQIPGLPREKSVPLLRIALSTTTAEQLRLGVGDRTFLTPDLNDVSLQRFPIGDQQPLAVEVTGLFVLRDPQAPYWFGDATLGTPQTRQSQSLDEKDVYAEAFVSTSDYATLLAATHPLPLGYEFRYFVDADRLDAGKLGRLGGDIARLEARYAGAGPLEPRVETGLGLVLDRYRGARSQAETLLAVAAIGLLVCALANLGLLGALSHERRRTETAVSRTRGASPLHVLGAQATEALLIAVPAGVAGWALALLVVDGRSSSLSAWLVLAIVAGTAVLLVAAITGLARRPLGPFGRDDVVLTRPSPRRLALEGLVVVAAGLGVFLLRRRGLQVSSDGGLDPYLAGVPVLLGLSCGIAALHLYPLPIAGAARLARRGRSLALHLGLSRLARQPGATSAPLLVLLLALAIASFSAAMLATLETGQEATSWRAVGADVRVDAPADTTLPPGLVARVQATGHVAAAFVAETANAAAGFGGARPPLLVALDLDEYERLLAGTPAAFRFPDELREPPPVAGTIPALASNWPTAPLFQLALGERTVTFLSVTDRASFPGIPSGTPFAIVSLPALERETNGAVAANRLYVRGASAGAVREALAGIAPRADVASRAAVLRALRASPLVESVLDGFRAAIVVAALFAAIAVGLIALIAARSRSRDLALVRTMGGSRREGIALAAVELTPLAATALALGIGLGIAVPFLISPGLDLAFYTGGSSDSIAIPWLPPVAFAAGLLALVAATIAVLAVRMRRARLDRVLRIGEA
jgi:putative ABC transport system permease protein